MDLGYIYSKIIVFVGGSEGMGDLRYCTCVGTKKRTRELGYVLREN